MQETQVTLPRIGTCDQARGLGWAIYNLDGGGQVIGHDGGTIGQCAFFRMVPESNLAIAVLANGGNMHNVWREIYARVLRDLPASKPRRRQSQTRPRPCRMPPGSPASTPVRPKIMWSG